MPGPETSTASDAPRGRSVTVLLGVLAVLFLGCVVFSIKAEKPWGRTVQKRVEKQQPLTPKEYAVIGLWWGVVTNAALLALLLATARKWMPRGQSGVRSPESVADGHPDILTSDSGFFRSRSFVFLFLALALAAWLRAPRLSHSLWNDEEYAMRKFAHGAWEQQKDSAWKFEPATWTETLFENRNGNNHVLNSLITRVSLDAWRLVSGAPREKFSEVALRTPAFVAGLLTIIMIFFLGRRIGGSVVGIGAAFILALCPWHLRYAVEAKGYSFMLLFVCTAIYALLRALEENRLRWWLAFALSEAAFVLSFAGSAYVALAVNIFAAVELIKTKQRARLWTLAAFNLLAAIPVIQWMLPSVPQLLNYLRSEQSLHLSLGWPFLRDFFSGLAIGFQFDNPGAHTGTSWLVESTAHPWIKPVFGILGAMFAGGFALSFFQNSASRLAIGAPVFAVIAAYLQNLLSGSPMVVWYLLYVILPASLAVPVALLKMKPRRMASPWMNVTLFVVAYGIVTHAPVMRLRDHPRQPMREAVGYVRRENANALTAVLGVSDKQIASYDPKAVVLESLDDLRALVSKSVQERLPLLVYVCGEHEAQRRQPEIMRAIEAGLKPQQEQGDGVANFKLVAEFDGTEAMFSYRVYRAENAGITKP